FGYAGYMYDKEIGMYYLMARYYHPVHGVFISVDPDPGDADDPITQNGYAYANNNPVVYVDPDGHYFWVVINAGFAVYDGYSAYKSGANARTIVRKAAFGAIGGGRFKLAGKIGATALKRSKGKGFVYLRTSNTGGKYVGQAKSFSRYMARQKEHHKKNPGNTYTFRVIGRANPGRPLNVLEQNMINRYGYPKRYKGVLENKRHQISEKNWKKYGIKRY
ncbi:RHS repeat-associated core domain-containing protein, partial [Ectobacillus antri]